LETPSDDEHCKKEIISRIAIREKIFMDKKRLLDYYWITGTASECCHRQVEVDWKLLKCEF